MCLQDECKLLVTRPAGQVQYLNIFVHCTYLRIAYIAVKNMVTYRSFHGHLYSLRK